MFPAKATAAYNLAKLQFRIEATSQWTGAMKSRVCAAKSHYKLYSIYNILSKETLQKPLLYKSNASNTKFIAVTCNPDSVNSGRLGLRHSVYDTFTPQGKRQAKFLFHCWQLDVRHWDAFSGRLGSSQELRYGK